MCSLLQLWLIASLPLSYTVSITLTGTLLITCTTIIPSCHVRSHQRTESDYGLTIFIILACKQRKYTFRHEAWQYTVGQNVVRMPLHIHLLPMEFSHIMWTTVELIHNICVIAESYVSLHLYYYCVIAERKNMTQTLLMLEHKTKVSLNKCAEDARHIW